MFEDEQASWVARPFWRSTGALLVFEPENIPVVVVAISRFGVVAGRKELLENLLLLIRASFREHLLWDREG